MALTYIKTSGLDPAATFTLANVSITSNLTVANANVTGSAILPNISLIGNITPSSNNVFSLGDPTHVFKDVYIGPGSLYIDGSKVLEASGADIVVTADLNQNLRVVTTGSGDVEIDPTGTGVIAIKGPLQFEAGTQVTSSDGNSIAFADPIAVDSLTSLTTNVDLSITGNGTGIVKIDDDLTVTGNLIIQGTSGNLSVTTLTVQDNIIDISAETTGAPSSNAGLRVIRGDDPSVQVRWNETSDIWQISNDGTNYLDILGKDSAGNVSVGNLSATGLSGTLSTAVQPNITSIGTLASLTVTGLVTATAGGIKVGNIQDPTGTSTVTIASGSISVLGNITAGTSGTGRVTATTFAGNLATAAQPNVTSIGTMSSLTVSGNANFASGMTLFRATQDVTIDSSPTAASTVNYDINVGVVFDVTPSGAWTANIGNVPTTTNRTTVVTFIITQGATAYLPSAVQVNGVEQTVKWINSAAPTGTASKVDVVAYSLVRSSAGAWTVLGQSASYG